MAKSKRGLLLSLKTEFAQDGIYCRVEMNFSGLKNPLVLFYRSFFNQQKGRDEIKPKNGCKPPSFSGGTWHKLAAAVHKFSRDHRNAEKVFYPKARPKQTLKVSHKPRISHVSAPLKFKQLELAL